VGLRIFIAAVVAASGFAMYAGAAVLWDRRRQLRLAPQVVALIVALAVVLGTGLLVGACMGAFRL